MVESIGGLLLASSRKYAQRCALKGRVAGGFEETTYGNLYEEVRDFGLGLMSLEVLPSDKIFILSDNRREWLVSDLSALSIGAVNVSRGGDATPAEIEYILNHSKAKITIVENAKQLEKVTALGSKLTGVERIVIMEGYEGPEGKEPIVAYQEILSRGRILKIERDAPFLNRLKAVQKSDLATIVYTSGTTGTPKGVMLTHQNILSNIEATLKSIKIAADDRFLSILPSWHMFERTVEYIFLSQGASIVYTSPRRFAMDMLSEKPTYLVCVPRVLETFYQRVLKKFTEKSKAGRTVISALLTLGKRYVLARRVLGGEERRFARGKRAEALAEGIRALTVAIILSPAYWVGGLLLYKKVRAATGGFLKAAITGGGSLPGYLDDFFELIGMMVLNGYGLTETSPILTVRTSDHNIKGTIGRPIAGTEVKIMDEQGKEIPEGEQGMIWVKGSQVMKGYFENEEATRKVLKEGGWFDTGDVGRITVTGDLVITGRAKDTIVLTGGENVEPEPIESLLQESAYIEHVMVVGQDRKYITALIRPSISGLLEYLGEKEMAAEALLIDPRVHKLIRKEIASRVNEARGFKPFERVVKFTLVNDEWSRENGLLTPTLKLKKNVIAERYKDTIEKIYEEQ